MSTPPAAAKDHRTNRNSDRDATFWLDGHAVLCQCPDCRAPMSVRLWLMIADCWRCGTSIELTTEQQSEIQELLRDTAATETLPAGAPVESRQAGFDLGTEHSAQAAAGAAAIEVAQAATPAATVTTRAWMGNWFRDAPAWLISLLVHLLLLTILALWTLNEEADDLITLSLRVSTDRQPGEYAIELMPEEEVQFDLPLPDNVDLTSPRQWKALVTAEADAKELQIDPQTPDPNMPKLDDVRRRIGETTDIQAALAARDPRVRVEMVAQEGGTTLTEAAVARGLRWLARQQPDDGGWRLRGYGGRQGVESRSSATGMALLAFLGAGQTHVAGRYQGEVSRGLRWLMDNQQANGSLLADSDRQAGMYAHGQAAIALCEAFAMTGDERLRSAAQRSIDFIVASQYSDGGWRYSPEEPRNPPGGDTSVLGWQLMALQSARAAGLHVPEHTLELSGHFLDSVQSFEGARYAYRADIPQPTPTMTAEALLCRVYLGWPRHERALQQGIEYLSRTGLSDRDVNIYYWYYATQVMHHVGGSHWQSWNTQMRDLLVDLQIDSGKHAGSWPPVGAYSDAGGRLYVTALSVCTLEVYYRHLPIFRRIELD